MSDLPLTTADVQAIRDELNAVAGAPEFMRQTSWGIIGRRVAPLLSHIDALTRDLETARNELKVLAKGYVPSAMMEGGTYPPTFGEAIEIARRVLAVPLSESHP